MASARDSVREEAARTDEGCKIGYKTKKELGRGEQGVAYSMNKNASGRNISETHVLKISALGSTHTVRRAWEAEAELSKILGETGLGPQIYDFWVCRGKGYILMQKMLGDLRHYKDSEGAISEKIIDKATGETLFNVDHLNRVPMPILRNYVGKLESMIDAGYVHFDNHPGNLGIVINVDGDMEGILFDFGFTRKVDGMTMADKYNALAFSIGQILEHMPTEELDTNYLFKILVSIDKGSYEFRSLEPNVSAADIAAFRAYYKIPAGSLGVDLTPNIKTPAGYNRPLYVGAKLYNYFLNMSSYEKYAWGSYGPIYLIRQGKAIPAMKASATIRSPEYPAIGATGAAVAAPTAATTGRILRSAKAKAGAGTGTRAEKRGGRRTRRTRRF